MNTFEEFKNKRKLWIQCLTSEDKNSIMNQIYRMVWSAAVFRIVNESIKLSPVNKNGKKQLNGMIFNLFDTCFFESQLTAIRRLTDSYTLDGKKGVFSLMPLLKDMENNKNLLTRNNYFKIEGLEYDYELARKKHMEQEKNKKVEIIYWESDELNPRRVIERHRELDILTGKSERNRSTNDCVCSEVFDFLMQELINSTKNVKTQVDKFIAHAAAPGSREEVNADKDIITLGYIWNANKVICQVANFIDLYLLSGVNHWFLPVARYGNFEFIDKVLVDTEKIKDLQVVWNQYDSETKTWGNWGLNEFQENIENRDTSH